jgi:hypothetical protein
MAFSLGDHLVRLAWLVSPTLCELQALKLVANACHCFIVIFWYHSRSFVLLDIGFGERVCCLLVLNSVTSTPQWIRQPEAAWGNNFNCEGHPGMILERGSYPGCSGD